jgi:hypothetical protein
MRLALISGRMIDPRTLEAARPQGSAKEAMGKYGGRHFIDIQLVRLTPMPELLRIRQSL